MFPSILIQIHFLGLILRSSLGLSLQSKTLQILIILEISINTLSNDLRPLNTIFMAPFFIFNLNALLLLFLKKSALTL